MYEATGTIKLIDETQTFGSGFTKREFVVTTEHDKYPQDLKFEVVNDKCSLLDSFEAGQKVVVNFDIRGNKYKGNPLFPALGPSPTAVSGASLRSKFLAAQSASKANS